jgi:SH3-like domain-containing protein
MLLTRRSISLVCCALALVLIPLLAGAAFAQKRTLCVYGVDAPGRLQAYARPSSDSPVVATFPARACGLRRAGRCSGTWCQMALGRRFGWVDSRSVGVYEAARPPPGAQSRPKASRAGQRRPPQPRLAMRTVQEPRRPVSFPFPFLFPFSFAFTPAPPIYIEQRRFAEDRRCVVDVASWDTLRVRRGPGVDYPTVGAIPPRACGVVEAGSCQGRWCRVAWRGQRGWVNTRYLN